MPIYSRSPEIDPESKELAAFADAVRVLSQGQGRDIRAQFHDTFLDTNSETYRERNMRVFVYDRNLRRNQRGLLWECRRSYRRATWDQIKSVMEGSREVFVLFDVFNAPPEVPDQGYGPFKRDDVLACRPAYLEVGLPVLPEDLYIFDRTFEWAGVLTHEPWTEGVAPYKFLTYANDPLHTLVSSGEFVEFTEHQSVESAHSAVIELWLDDRHFADLCRLRNGDTSLRLQSPARGWRWEIPIAQLDDAVARATFLLDG